MQDPGEPTHLAAARRPARLLEPVVHDAALPRVVRVPRRGHRGVERPPPGAEAAGGGVGGGGGEGGREGLEGGAEGDEHVVGEERRGEGHEHQRQRAAAAAARGSHGGARGRAAKGRALLMEGEGGESETYYSVTSTEWQRVFGSFECASPDASLSKTSAGFSKGLS